MCLDKENKLVDFWGLNMVFRTFEEIAKPFHDAKKKIKEEDVVDLIHRLRKEWVN